MRQKTRKKRHTHTDTHTRARARGAQPTTHSAHKLTRRVFMTSWCTYLMTHDATLELFLERTVLLAAVHHFNEVVHKAC